MNDFPITSASGQEMLDELPDYYEPIFEARVIVQVEGDKFDQLQADIEGQLKQRFAGTATWDLSAWEKEFGIVPKAGQPIEQRRSVVRSKMRGVGKFTGRLLKNVAEAYDNGTVAVSFDPALSEFTVTFIDTTGIPPNIDDLKAAIEDIMPAHLIVAFEYNYFLFMELDAKGWTFSDLDALGLTWAQLEVYN